MMLKFVLDTNIIVSALLKPDSKPAYVFNTFTDRRIDLYYSDGIMAEYKRVLSYTRLKFSDKLTSDTIGDVVRLGKLLSVTPSVIPLPDETDRVFYDTAAAVGAYLVTGNMKHYPDEPHILTPAAFLDTLAELLAGEE